MSLYIAFIGVDQFVKLRLRKKPPIFQTTLIYSSKLLHKD